MLRRIELIALWSDKCSALQHAGPFTIWIPAHQKFYSTAQPHYVTWNGFWINAAQPLDGYAAALDAMEEMERCQQQA